MAKNLDELLGKIDPEVVRSAKQKSQDEILRIRLAMLREELNISQLQLANQLGISQPSVANLEKRGEEIKLSSLKRYVDALGGKLTINIKLPDGKNIDMVV